MDNEKTILYLAHSKPGSYVFRETARYLEQFPGVEIRAIAGNPIPFPATVEEITLAWMVKAMESGYERDFLEAVGKAQEEGYGATACASAGDFALRETQERFSIPYVGMGWANYWKAVQIGGRFSHFHTHLSELIEPISLCQIKAYGFLEHLVSIEHVNVDIYRYAAREEEPDLENFIDIAMPSVRQCAAKGAKVITIGCGSTELSRFAVKLNSITLKEYGIHVLPPIDTVVDVAREMMRKRWERQR